MNERRLTTLLVVFLGATVAFSCNRAPTSEVKNDNTNASTASAGGSSVGPSTETDPQKAAAQLQLLPNLKGIYTMSELEQDGTVTIVPRAYVTVITFMEDGFYNRVSKRFGVEDHTDSGYFRIERADDGSVSLIFSPRFTGKNMMQSKGDQKHGVTLSSEGDVMRLTSAKGKVAVFRRTGVAQPKVLQ